MLLIVSWPALQKFPDLKKKKKGSVFRSYESPPYPYTEVFFLLSNLTHATGIPYINLIYGHGASRMISEALHIRGLRGDSYPPPIIAEPK